MGFASSNGGNLPLLPPRPSRLLVLFADHGLAPCHVRDAGACLRSKNST